MDSVNLIRSRQVADLIQVLANDTNEHNGMATFGILPDDVDVTDKYERSLFVSIDYDRFVDFGSPEQITVSIEPGDILTKEYNEEQCVLEETKEP